jgi:hypothetical protein
MILNLKRNIRQKKSIDKKNIGQIRLVKSEEKSTLYVTINKGDIEIKKILLEKNNWWSFDSAYKLAKKSKWLDNMTFGYSENCCFSIEKNEIINNLKFEENDF